MPNNMPGQTAIDAVRIDRSTPNEINTNFYKIKYPENPNPNIYAASLNEVTGEFNFILKPEQCSNCLCIFTPTDVGQKECEICREPQKNI